MSQAAVATTWDWLWDKHDQVKDLVALFAKPASSAAGARQQPAPGTAGNAAGGPEDKEPRTYKTGQLVGLILGPLLFLMTLLLFNPEGLSDAGQAVLASTLWVATWWVTEALPIPVTSLLPIVLFPITAGLPVAEISSSYADDTIFLFMGGFMIALAMEKWNLHKRIALNIISVCGTSTERIILGFILATGFLSMWISNTATAMMMVPIGLAIIYQVADSLKDEKSVDTSKENFVFGKVLMLAIAYAASIGGLGTLIGSPPNAILVSVVEETYGISISFAQWMLFGAPIAIIFLFILWFYLVKFAFRMNVKDLPGGRDVIRKEKKALGQASVEEKIVFVVFTLTALAWITRTFFLSRFIEGVSDAGIAIAASVVLFLIPTISKRGGRILDWETAVKLPWGILLLFGGGLAIAAAFVETGLADWVGEQLMFLEGMPVFIVLLVIVAITVFLTEFTSNTATATMLYPIMASLAAALAVHPYALLVAAAVGASYAFMMPVGTPPNAVVFGSGYLRIPEMIRAGAGLNVLVIAIIPVAIYFLLPLLWGIDLSVFPQKFE
ncbi:MAG TPA: SLC13 family permease [Arthrobacter sp.]|nr:SLC13 family permease [Arthrobacter sp.]